ncbi:MAG: YraN family protein [Burkholderiales bacterium]
MPGWQRGAAAPAPVSERARIGRDAEDRALAHLEKQGMSLVARNHRCKGGEVDLIMRDRDTLVFVEVRLRGRGAWSGAAESIDRRKQARIILAAQHFLMRRAPVACRFDCVVFEPGSDPAPRWLRDAFRL